MRKLLWIPLLFLAGCGNPTGGHLVRVTSPSGMQWIVCQETAHFRYGVGGVSFDTPGGRVDMFGAVVESIGTCPTGNY